MGVNICTELYINLESHRIGKKFGNRAQRLDIKLNLHIPWEGNDSFNFVTLNNQDTSNIQNTKGLAERPKRTPKE